MESTQPLVTLADNRLPNHEKILFETDVKRGLQELNSAFHFDLAGCIDQWHPRIDEWQGVYWYGRHVCSMDRGWLPEMKEWEIGKALMEVEWADADKDDVTIHYEGVPVTDPNYMDLRIAAAKKLDHRYMILASGSLVRLTPKAMRPSGKRVKKLGWRHTFEGILNKARMWDIPNVTRQSIATKFGVDMMKFPTGPPDQVYAALVEE